MQDAENTFEEAYRRIHEAHNKFRRSEIARMGGLKVAEQPGHMAEIGRIGGLKVSQDREYMAEIGRRGGRNSKSSR